MRPERGQILFKYRVIAILYVDVSLHLLLNNLCVLFAGGCEYLSDRMDETELQKKLINFLNMRTKQGYNHDSYLLYYSGPVNSKGDWLLKGEMTCLLINRG